MTGPVFVDANVFLYARDEREPAKLPRARAWLDHLWREGLGRTSVQVLSEYYVNLKRKAFSSPAPDEAWEAVAKYLSWRPQAVNDEVFTRAREIEKRYRLSWWDAMVVAAAQLQECRVLLTEDLQESCIDREAGRGGQRPPEQVKSGTGSKTRKKRNSEPVPD
jgi:predicted nucleic acid-binding protein